MTVFQFPESTFNFDLTPFGKQNQTLDDISFNTENNEEYIEQSDFTIHLEEFLDNLK